MTTFTTPRFPLSKRPEIEPIQGSALSLEVWLDRFSTELARLRPHLGYTGAAMVARVLFSRSRQEPPHELARLAAEEMAFMSEIDRR